MTRIFQRSIFASLIWSLLLVTQQCLTAVAHCENEYDLQSLVVRSGNLKYIRTQVAPEIQQQAAQEALERLLKSRSTEIAVKVDPSITTSEYVDAFLVSSDELSGLITITGTTGVSALYGVYDYLQNYCSALIVWEGSQLNLPNPLPRANYQKTIVDRFRYYQNVCTDSYSFVWWDWDRWEKEIDWMALHGINLPLAFTGQEEIWRRVYLKLGLSEQDVLEYITGPGFLAWWRMGNIQKFGGPIPLSFLNRKLDLLHKILSRMRNLGLTPVLPAFAGNVPSSITKLFPNVTLIENQSWNHFNKSYSTFMLAPTDPLFRKIGKLFLAELTGEVGTNHIYNCDGFNENDPSENSTEFLKAAAQMTYAAMTDVDSKAVWMMQSWVFYSKFWEPKQVEAYLSGIDKGNALILDLEADRRPLYSKLDNFHGHSFIWCMLQNYGGTMNLYGALDLVNNGIQTARSSVPSVPSDQLVGVGSCPEGINQNSVMFEFDHGVSLHLGQVNVTEWIYKYSNLRYGVISDHLHQAWFILRNGPYNAPKEIDNHGYSVATKRPSLKMNEKLWYNPEDMRRVVGHFLLALNTSKNLNTSELYRHDLVDFTRQFLVLFVAMNYRGLVNSFQKKRQDKFNEHATTILKIFDDLEKILATKKQFLLGPWVKASQLWSESEKDKLNLRYNALNQITLWGSSGEISDYAAKQWSGSMEFYYKPRWQHFITALNTSLHTGEPFNSKRFRKSVLKNVEIPFTFSNQTFPTTPKGDSIFEAERIYKYWNKSFSRLSSRMRKRRNNGVAQNTILTNA